MGFGVGRRGENGDGVLTTTGDTPHRYPNSKNKEVRGKLKEVPGPILWVTQPTQSSQTSRHRVPFLVGPVTTTVKGPRLLWGCPVLE